MGREKRGSRRENRPKRRRFDSYLAGKKAFALFRWLLSPVPILLLTAFTFASSQVLDAQREMQHISHIDAAVANGSSLSGETEAGPTPTPVPIHEQSDVSSAQDSQGNVKGVIAQAAPSGSKPVLQAAARHAQINPALQWAAYDLAAGETDEDGRDSKRGASLAKYSPSSGRGTIAGTQRGIAPSSSGSGTKNSLHGGRSTEEGRSAYRSHRMLKGGVGFSLSTSKHLNRQVGKLRSATLSAEEAEKVRRDYKNAYKHSEAAQKAPASVSGVERPTSRGLSSPSSSSGKSKKLETVHESDVGKPKGAKKTGSGEFLGSHLADGSSMVRGQNVTRLSYALYKIVRLFNLRKLADFPSASHVEWIPEMVHRFEYDVPGFSYEGLDLSEKRLDVAKKAGELFGSAEFQVIDPEKEIPDSIADMLLLWTELDGERTDPRSPEYVRYIINVIKAAKRAKVRYITFGQFPRLKGVAPIYSKGKWRFMGSKEEPFLFNEYVRGVVPMASGSNGYHLHLTLFSLKSFTDEDLNF